MNNLKLKRILNLKGIGQEQEHHVLLMLTHGLILTSEFDTTKVTEVEMAKNHLQDLNNDFNLKKFVFIFDRGYGSY